MNVDLEAIARRGGCEVASLRNALPLLQQGYSPPFLARYRRDELGGINEATLWALMDAINADRAIADEQQRLLGLWEATPLADPAIEYAIRKSNSKRMLERLKRRLKSETAENASASDQLAVRLLNPRKGDGADIAALVTKIDSIKESEAAAAVDGLDAALAKRLAGDPRVINAAVKWLSRNAKISIASISDPHTPAAETAEADTADTEVAATSSQGDAAADAAESQPLSGHVDAVDQPASEAVEATVCEDSTGSGEQVVAEQTSEAVTAKESSSESSDSESSDSEASDSEASDSEASDSEASDSEASDSEASDSEASDSEASDSESSDSEARQVSEPESVAGADSTVADDPSGPASPSPAATESSSPTRRAPGDKPASPSMPAREEKKSKKSKKMSPRQRRRRWLVSVLKPLAGKRLAANKLSSFQIVMLGRALRSQVAHCSFEYDAAKLVSEIQRTVTGINRQIESKLKDTVLEHEANIRESAEAAWWDELHERASSRLVGIVADHLQAHINRGCVDAKVVMSIDAVGPRTAAVSIVSADGRVLHCEDLPCQLSSALRSQAVARMGELIHQFHVDLIVLSNGPARRGCMTALSDLIGQSPEKSVRWTLSDRMGADVYAGSNVASQEMRSTPRRFRAAAWLAFSVLQPAQAFAKVDPAKLRLASFQRELSDQSIAKTLESVVVSGASRGGVDVNSASTEWLGRLPGMTAALAQSIDSKRQESLLNSREELLELDAWQSVVESRQALPFLRVFGSDEVLDGTLIHPDDYPLAKKLANSLEIELPPAMPPGYQPPTFQPEPSAASQPTLSELPATEEKPEVEDVTAAAEEKAGAAFAEDVAEAPAAEAPADEAPADEAPAEATAETASSDSQLADQSAGAPAADSEPAQQQPDSATEESPNQPEHEQAAVEAAESVDTATEVAEPTDTSAVAQQAPEPVRRDRPDQAKIDKCIKEWQIGARRANQLVSWLCDPFGDSDLSGRPPAVLTTMPSQKSLKPGDEVIGVVVGVMPFGVFVELTPDCSGLIHISKISDRYVEDLHEAIQVGDVITAWVTGIDEKKRRVALSAVSPEREAELQQQKRQPMRGKSGRPPRGGDRRSRDGGKPASGEARPRGGGQERSRGRAGGGDRGRGRDQRRGGRREKKPESYRVVGKKESAPISDAMKKGEEPLRSFGDLMQFYSKDEEPQQTSKDQSTETAPQPPPEIEASVPEPESSQPESPQPESAGEADAAAASDADDAIETPPQVDTGDSADQQPRQASQGNQQEPDSASSSDEQSAELPSSPDTSAS